jgi:hypothetical protein
MCKFQTDPVKYCIAAQNVVSCLHKCAEFVIQVHFQVHKYREHKKWYGNTFFLVYLLPGRSYMKYTENILTFIHLDGCGCGVRNSRVSNFRIQFLHLNRNMYFIKLNYATFYLWDPQDDKSEQDYWMYRKYIISLTCTTNHRMECGCLFLSPRIVSSRYLK